MDKIQIEGQKKSKEKLRSVDPRIHPYQYWQLLYYQTINKIKNVPRLSDVFNDKDIRIIKLKISLNKDFVKLKHFVQIIFISYDLVRKMRASFLILGPC